MVQCRRGSQPQQLSSASAATEYVNELWVIGGAAALRSIGAATREYGLRVESRWRESAGAIRMCMGRVKAAADDAM